MTGNNIDENNSDTPLHATSKVKFETWRESKVIPTQMGDFKRQPGALKHNETIKKVITQ